LASQEGLAFIELAGWLGLVWFGLVGQSVVVSWVIDLCIY
jgi:hypothetical protein